MLSRIHELGFAPSLLIASLCGFVLSLGAPPDGWVWGHWLGWLPLILMARRTQVDWRQAALLGLAGGMGVGLGGFPWIAELLVKFTRVPGWLGLAGLVLFSAWMALPYAIWAIGLRMGSFDGWRGLSWPVVLFVTLQSLWPQLFPYTPLLGFAEHPELMQLAEIGGVHLIEALVVLFGLLLTNALVRRETALRIRHAGVALLIPLAMFFYGDWRMGVMDAMAEGARTLRLGIVQPNVPIGRLSPETKMDRLRAPSIRAQRAGAQLVIWPEAGAYPYGVSRPFLRDRQLRHGRVLEQHQLPTIFGANTRAPGERFGYNTVFHMAKDGEVRGYYDKVNLVPMGEAIPLIDPDWVTDRIPQIAHHHSGEGPVRFLVEPADRTGREAQAEPIAVGPLICYEDILPAFVRAVSLLEGGVELFVNVTIDAWYGDSAEPWEHLALSQFRSVEHRIPLVRSVSTGVSAVIDHTGRLVAKIPPRPVARDTLGEYPPEILVESVRLPRNTATDPTFFARVGWVFPHLCQLATAAAIAAWLWRRRGSSRQA